MAPAGSPAQSWSHRPVSTALPVPPTSSTSTVEAEEAPLEHSADLTECQAEFASHPFLSSPWYLLQGKPSVFTAFLSLLGEANETELL